MPGVQMARLRRRWAAWVVGVVVAGFAALNVIAWNHARAMLCFTEAGARTRSPEQLRGVAKLRVLFTGINVPRPVNATTPADHWLTFRAPRLPRRAGCTVRSRARRRLSSSLA